MSAELKPDLQLEIAYLLLIDVVGYSKLLVNEQIELMQYAESYRAQAQNVSRRRKRAASLSGCQPEMGWRWFFSSSPEEPAQCALEISKALKEHAKHSIDEWVFTAGRSVR